MNEYTQKHTLYINGVYYHCKTEADARIVEAQATRGEKVDKKYLIDPVEWEEEKAKAEAEVKKEAESATKKRTVKKVKEEGV